MYLLHAYDKFGAATRISLGIVGCTTTILSPYGPVAMLACIVFVDAAASIASWWTDYEHVKQLNMYNELRDKIESHTNTKLYADHICHPQKHVFLSGGSIHEDVSKRIIEETRKKC